MAKRFSLEAQLDLQDNLTAKMTRAQNKLLGFSRSLSKMTGGMREKFGGVYSFVDKMNAGFLTAGKYAAGFSAAAIAAGAAASYGLYRMIAGVADTADEYAKQARQIGITTEALQALSYAADIQGVSNETLMGSLEKLNKNVGDLRAGTGMLRTYLEKTDQALLNQLHGVKTNEEAFALFIGAINKAPTEFEKAALAQAAFGRAGQDMLRLAEAGADGLRELTSEAIRYGVISDETARMAETFNDEQTRLKRIWAGLKNQLTTAILPAMTDMILTFRKFVETWILGNKEIIKQKIEAAAEKLVDGLKKVITWVQAVDFGKVILGIKSFGEKIMLAVDFLKKWGPALLVAIGILEGFRLALFAAEAAQLAVNLAIKGGMVISKLGSVISGATVLWKLYAGGASAAQVASLGINAALGTTGASIAAVVGPIGLIVGFFAAWVKYNEEIQEFFTWFEKTIAGPVGKFVDKFSLFGRSEKQGMADENGYFDPYESMYRDPSTPAVSRSYSESVERQRMDVYVKGSGGAQVSRDGRRWSGELPVSALAGGKQ